MRNSCADQAAQNRHRLMDRIDADRGEEEQAEADDALVIVASHPSLFLFVFFIAEFLPPAAGQLGTAIFGVLLAIGFAWIGVALWLRDPGT